MLPRAQPPRRPRPAQPGSRVRPSRLGRARAGNPGPGRDVQAPVATCAWVPVCGRVHCVRRRAPERRGQGGEMECSPDSGFSFSAPLISMDQHDSFLFCAACVRA